MPLAVAAAAPAAAAVRAPAARGPAFRAPALRASRMQRPCTRIFAKNGIFYSTSTGNTEDMAGQIQEALGGAFEDPQEADEGVFAEYDNLIVGAPTWNTGADEQRSGTAWDELEADDIGDLSGKTVACFGLGDSGSYGDYFCDAMGELHDKFEAAGAKMVGYVSSDDYTFDGSKSVKDGKFVGLALDEDSEGDKSEERIKNWAAQLKTEMSL